MDNQTAARIQIRDQLIALISAKDHFREALLADQSLPIWLMEEHCDDGGGGDGHTRNADLRRHVADICLRLTYAPDQPGQETQKLTGLVGISASTLKLGEDLNTSKLLFKESIQAYRKQFGSSFEMTDLSSRELRETILGRMNIQHIHFVQCYRQLKLFPIPPKRVGFSWANATHGSVRLTATKAIDHLRSKYTPGQGLFEDIQILQNLPENQEVVIKRPLVPHLRANLTWPEEIKRLRANNPEIRKDWPGQVNAPLPLFMQLEEGEELPAFNQIKPRDPDNKPERQQRNDRRLVPLSNRPGSLIFTRIG
ncbi:DNA replication terminus site-binding protein [Parendozoicomonas haliclonae]|uniref:DNA replication terminus site-binding protein n=1 Tax=Parendozoicomonas haliclonae TaxID=1960125 RepID=A0A1X7AI64_9GAMM|nr:DNA replication terminus site-binding protein [Parendozoicomonas haliclonae]SMA42904.1 hypothetical protein EHSB41UT_01523 [Parendozoicomonas haliclonae]